MNIRATLTLFVKEIRRFSEVWTQTIGAPLVSNLLFLLIFGTIIGGQAQGINGFSYLQLLVPGLAGMGLMTNAFSNPIGSLMVGKYTNAIIELLMIPMRGFEIVLAYVTAGVIRGAVVGAVTVVVGLFFTQLPFVSVFWILLFSVLVGGTFASAGVVVGIVSETFDQSSVIQNFVLTPLVYLGGVFYSISALPELFQTLSRLNPIFYMIDGLRYGFLGVSDSSLWLSFFVTLICFFIFFAAASWMFQTGYRLRT